MDILVSLGKQQIVGFSYNLGSFVSEHPFGTGVDQEDISILIDYNNALSKRLKQCAYGYVFLEKAQSKSQLSLIDQFLFESIFFARQFRFVPVLLHNRSRSRKNPIHRRQSSNNKRAKSALCTIFRESEMRKLMQFYGYFREEHVYEL